MKFFLPVILCCSLSSIHAATIWQEGEAAEKSTMHRHPWWFDQVKKDLLSGGDWISNFAKEEGTAHYSIEAPAAGEYQFWVRAAPVGTHLSFQLNGGAWTEIDLQKDKRGEQNIAADGKPDLRFIAWSKVGGIKMAQGKQTISFKMHGSADNHGGLDCFCLTNDGFVPQGTMKPGSSVAAVQADADPSEAIWIEGENATRKNVTRHPWWYDQVKKDVLSGGEWISHFDDKKAGSAEYDFNVLTAGTYAFWVRANPLGTTLTAQLDKDAVKEVNFKDARGEQNIAADNKPDIRFLAWVKVGDVELKAGAHTLKFGFDSKNSHHGGLDCLCLTRIPFVPNGAAKPGGKALAAGPRDWFPLLADEDTFSKESVIDMSALIEAPAGKHGFVKAVGDQLQFSEGSTPVKFWGVNANQEQGKLDKEGQLRRIKYLKKFGNNVVRQHTVFDEVSTAGKIDSKKLDAYDWWFSELKKAGIYTDWSVFYHFPISAADGYDPALFAELPEMGKEGLRDTYGLISMSPKLWEIRTKVLVALLNHKNPYTGLKYAEDPALMAVEFQNEDCVFFWNPLGELASANPKKVPLHAKEFRRQFAAWVKAKYQTDAAVKAAWGKLEGESLASGELALMGPWELDSRGIRGRFAGQTKRAGDQLKFMSDLQRGFYEQCEKAVRATGFKAQTITTNWLGGSGLTDQVNIHTDLIGSMIDRHNYAGGGAGGHGITEGQIFADSHLAKPGQYLFSIGMKQVEDRPFSMTEWTMCPPTRWKLESAPIFAFYGMGLQGWDCSYHFIQSGSRLGDGWPNMSSYSSDTPHYMGQFPALAFALHKNHLKESPPLASRRATEDALFTGKAAWQQDYYNGNDLVKAQNGTPPEVFALGKVTVGFGSKGSEIKDWSTLWDQKHKVLNSTTGELSWDYGRERILISSPKTQGILGKPGKDEIKLPGVSVTVKTPFVSLLFTPLDDQPLETSRQILITAIAQDKQTGATYSDDGTKLLSTGTAPLLMEPVQAAIKLVGAKPVTVKPLDHYGVPMSRKVMISADGGFEINGLSKAYYYEVKR